jgi:hypothetical protein
MHTSGKTNQWHSAIACSWLPFPSRSTTKSTATTLKAVPDNQNFPIVVLLHDTLLHRITLDAEAGTRNVFSLPYNLSFD